MTEPRTAAGRALTVDEVAALSDGDAIRVIWSGGNGPHNYIVYESAGTLYAGDPRNDNAITGLGAFVGQEHYHTRIWRLVPEAEARAAALDDFEGALHVAFGCQPTTPCRVPAEALAAIDALRDQQ